MTNKLLAVGAVLALGACGSQDHTETKMRQAIDNAAQFNQVCLPHALNVEHRSGSEGNALIGAPQIKLLKRQENGKRANPEAVKQMERLVRAGLYDEEKEEKGEAPANGKETPRYLVYSLTDLGKEKIRLGHHGALLCVGTAKVEKINYFTEPTPARGYTLSQVNYTAKIVPEKWSKGLLKDNPAFRQEVERSATLVKTNDGWRDIRELHY
ncbi:hypothetical protein [Conchiformibius kuhniae]|uniref:Lipoprotein n=1 Tax=Conchiformibius kuhniae TaxID=211502 RepID=A0A8T9MV22_9NEIS|nr:hypothetical protein [Conchiformibius kuhniae]UOP04705.1 hypothetical protein LVJ77_11025 [Conchiformibius kuhniae]